MTVGVLDWGIGGLDVVANLRRRGVRTPVVYVSDAGAVPYGKQSDQALTARVLALVHALAEHGCTQVIVGCNAASTILHDPRFASSGPQIHGVIEPGIRATLEAGVDEVSVLGGRRTVESGLYGAALRAAGVSVREVVAQPLSALVERGVLEGPELEAAIRAIVEPVRDTTALVSACTHYLAVLPALRAGLPHVRTVIDPAQALAARFEPAAATGAPDRFWTTGDPAASRVAAARAFGVDAPFECAGDQLPAP